MDDQKITRVSLKGQQIDKALERIKAKNKKADIEYLKQIPAYGVVLDGVIIYYIWLLFEGSSMRVAGAVASGDRNAALTVPVLEHLKESAKAAGLESMYFLTSRPGMVKLSKRAGFSVDEVVMVTEL